MTSIIKVSNFVDTSFIASSYVIFVQDVLCIHALLQNLEGEARVLHSPIPGDYWVREVPDCNVIRVSSLTLEEKGDKLERSGEQPGNRVHIRVVGMDLLGKSKETCIFCIVWLPDLVDGLVHPQLILNVLVTADPPSD